VRDRSVISITMGGVSEMAQRGVAWPAIAAAFGISPAGVRSLCRDLPRRPPAGRRATDPT
jgi:hypothetical protein